jgi:hypothetical protein
MNTTTVLLSVVLAGTMLACDKPVTAAETPVTPAKAGPAANTAAASPRVSSIVFVGKEHACDCTRKTITTTWEALQKALGTPSTIPVTQVQVDTEAEKARPYMSMRPIMALPAIYFLDATGKLVEVTQGEVTPEQIKVAMAGPVGK